MKNGSLVENVKVLGGHDSIQLGYERYCCVGLFYTRHGMRVGISSSIQILFLHSPRKWGVSPNLGTIFWKQRYLSHPSFESL
jgi:hypothetical protein